MITSQRVTLCRVSKKVCIGFLLSFLDLKR
jgi:hypothetical protein